jgi:cell division protein FtsQ
MMKKQLRFNADVKRNSLKRHSGDIFKEIGTGLFLVFAIITVTSALIFGWHRVIRSDVFSIKETAVRGCNELTQKDVLSLAGISPHAKMFTLNKEAVIRRIKSNLWVKDVFVGREFPNRLVILVKERVPVALIEKNKKLYLIDNKGEIFKKLEVDEKVDLPILTGFSSGDRINTELIHKSLALLNHLNHAKDYPDLGLVSEVHGNEVFGFSLFTEKGLCLQLGFEGYETKLKSLDKVITDLRVKNLQTEFVLIDLSNPEKISVQSRAALQPKGFGLPKAHGEKLQI